MLHLCVLNHYLRRRRSRDWLRHLVSPLLGLLMIGYVLHEMDQRAKWMGFIWLCIGVVYSLVLTRLLRKPVTLAR